MSNYKVMPYYVLCCINSCHSYIFSFFMNKELEILKKKNPAMQPYREIKRQNVNRSIFSKLKI